VAEFACFSCNCPQCSPFQIVWNGQIHQNETNAIPKGAPNKEEALPFWTIQLVGNTGWMVLLQGEGVVNETLVWLGTVAVATILVVISIALMATVELLRRRLDRLRGVTGR
jgi:hypothetical protein